MKPQDYNNLKDVYKVKEQSGSLYAYLLANNEFDVSKLFKNLTKEELIAKYKRLSEKHLKLLENL